MSNDKHDLCALCKKSTNESEEILFCSKCYKFIHIKCEGVSQRGYKAIKHNKVQYCCNLCKTEEISESETCDKNKKQKTSNKNTLDMPHSSMDMNNLVSVVTNIQESLEFMNKQFEEFRKDNLELRKCLNMLTIVQTENKNMKTEISNLKYKVNKMELLELQNNVVISGVPVQNGDEKIEEIVSKVGKAVNCSIISSHIQKCYRKLTNRNNSIIVVQFKNKSKRDELLTKRKEGGNLFLQAIDLPGEKSNNQIYISEHRTPHSNQLFNEAMDLKKKKEFKYVWFKDGAILVRKDEKSKVMEVKGEEDIKKLLTI